MSAKLGLFSVSDSNYINTVTSSNSSATTLLSSLISPLIHSFQNQNFWPNSQSDKNMRLTKSDLECDMLSETILEIV